MCLHETSDIVSLFSEIELADWKMVSSCVDHIPKSLAMISSLGLFKVRHEGSSD